VNGYECQCTSGYTGDQCETVVVDCYSNPCLARLTSMSAFPILVRTMAHVTILSMATNVKNL
jgi:hypothetical protein